MASAKKAAKKAAPKKSIKAAKKAAPKKTSNEAKKGSHGGGPKRR